MSLDLINGTLSKDSPNHELKLGILKICLFTTFFVLGLIGNSLVLIGIGLNKGMQTPTNLLIFNLALADVLFIIFCIPTTLCGFFGLWPFAEAGCKLAQFINHLSAFMSIYLLVFMSIDRYLAIVHAIDSISNYRTTKNTTVCIIALWLIGICLSLIIGSLFTVINYDADNPNVSVYCTLKYLRPELETVTKNLTENSAFGRPSSNSNLIFNETTSISPIDVEKSTLPIGASLYWLGFVLFLYALPLSVIVILYGLMLKFLRGRHGQSVGKSKRRATRMILAVILTYAVCWFLMQLLFISNVALSRNTGHGFATYMDILTMLANVFAYLNSCTNPILYGFMSKNFRSSFIDLLCCRYSKRNLFSAAESVNSRRAKNNKFRSNSTLNRRENVRQISTATRYSQLDPTANLTNENFLTKNGEIQPTNDEEENLTIFQSSQNVTVGTQTNVQKKIHRRRKHQEKTSIVDFAPWNFKTKNIFCE